MASQIAFALFIVNGASDDFGDEMSLAFEPWSEGTLELVLDWGLVSERSVSFEPLASLFDDVAVVLEILRSLLAEVKLDVLVPVNLVGSPSYEAGMLGAVVCFHSP